LSITVLTGAPEFERVSGGVCLLDVVLDSCGSVPENNVGSGKLYECIFFNKVEVATVVAERVLTERKECQIGSYLHVSGGLHDIHNI